MATQATKLAPAWAGDAGGRRDTASTRTLRVSVWDLPLRLFHAALGVSVITSIISAKIGGDWMKVHGWAGFTVLGLLAFRVAWGLIGSTHARFANFWPTPGRLSVYLRGRWEGLGHNPLGACSVLVLLGLLALQSLTGLFSCDDIAYAGPWAAHIQDAWVSRITGWHQQASNVLLVFIALHLLAVTFHVWVKRSNIVRPMFTGYKEIHLDAGSTDHAEVDIANAKQPPAWAVLLALAAAALAVAVGTAAVLPEASTNEAPAVTSAPPATTVTGATPSW